ncbi:MAG: hypothetical protein HQL88_00945 [Magnetococcales bacterium]|nr:hypothetical protein [Magnetococcales bacterium]
MVSYPSLFHRSFFRVLPLLMGLVLAIPQPASAGDVPQQGGSGRSSGHPAHNGPADHPPLEVPEGRECVQPAEWMRRNHMDFLKHNRDMAVREGVRVKDDSLKNCSTCHKSREKFCDRCHAYVAVAPNCFECHDYPK